MFSPSKHRFGSGKNESKIYFGSEKKFCPEKNLGQKKFGFGKILVGKNFGSEKNFGTKKNFGPEKKFGPEKV